MKKSEHAARRKLALCIAAAVVLLLGVFFGVKALRSRDAEPAQTTQAATGAQDATASQDTVAVQTTQTPVTTALAAETTQPVTETGNPDQSPDPPMLGYIEDEEVRLNFFITGIVQQEILNSETDLDEDAELIRFVFGYRRTNAPASILDQEADGVVCHTLTLEQVNETLNELFGKTVSPDQEDYSIPIDETNCFHCVYRDGCFWNVPPYPEEAFSFPLRFALVDKIDEEHGTAHFRLYKINPYVWGVGEAERHVPIMPMASIYEVENGTEETKLWNIRIGEGTVVYREVDNVLQLVDLTAKTYY